MEENEEEASLSFLESFLSRPLEKLVPENEPNVIGPGLLECRIEIPRKIELIFKSIPQIDFIYSIVEGDRIVIRRLDDNSVLKEIHTLYYGEEHLPPHTESSSLNSLPELFFLFGRNEYEAKKRQELKRRYRNAIDKNEAFPDIEQNSSLRREWISYQVLTGNNIVYLNSGAELSTSLRNIMKTMNSRSVALPRLKTYREENKNGFVCQLLSNIPGMSSCAARCISERFPSLALLREAMRRDELGQLVVAEEDGSKRRRLSNRTLQKLNIAFCSTLSAEKL